MTIIARYTPKNIKVVIEDVYESGGVKLASITALEGKPFVGGDKWPVRTEYATVKAAELDNIHTEGTPEPERPNLLNLALAAYQEQWSSGEAKFIYGNVRGGAFLKNLSGTVYLFVVGHSKPLPVFVLDWKNGAGWVESKQVHQDYAEWSHKARQAVTK